MAIHLKRVSLLAQAVERLRAGIASGEWTTHLPPERRLSESMKISRSTLRRAMTKIEEEGLIAVGCPGKRREIIAKPKMFEKGSDQIRIKKVIWLTCNELHEIPTVNLRSIVMMQEMLATYQCLLHVLRIPDKVLAYPESRMAGWLDEQGGDVWLLHLMPPAVQQWFYQFRPTSCIFGSRAEGVDLASVDIDTPAAMRHALAMLKRRGHKRVALVRSASDLVGENVLEAILHEQFDERDGTVIACPSEPERMGPIFEQVFADRGKGMAPTALVCSIPSLAMFALTWLQQNGITVPGDVSLVLLRSELLLNYSSPRITHYAINEMRTITLFFPRLVDLLESQTCETSHIGLLQELIEGESVADFVE